MQKKNGGKTIKKSSPAKGQSEVEKAKKKVSKEQSDADKLINEAKKAKEKSIENQKKISTLK